LDFPAIVISVG
jgi:hypothetical protein